MIRIASLLILFAFGGAAAQHPLTPAEGTASIQDLKNLAWSAGFGLEIFDYDVPRHHCLSFTVELGEVFSVHSSETAGEPNSGSDAGHICNTAGAYRLTVQWTRDTPEVEFEFKSYERDSGVGSGIGGTTVNVENAFGWSLYGLPERVLRLGESTEIVKMAFSVSKDGQRVPVTIRATLQENPDGQIGSLGRVQSISR